MKEIIKKNAVAARVIRVVRSKQYAMMSRIQLEKRVIELEAQLSVVHGRSSLNAERNVRTHASLQNLAEDFNALQEQLALLASSQDDTQASASEDE